jgi:transposase
MSMIPQTTLFSWENEIENLGDNERLTRVLDNLPDENLMRLLEKERGRGRNDYPIRAMWNMLIAMIVFGHGRFADIIREMKRNIQLRYICGFEGGKTPGADNMSRFVSNLMKHQEELLKIFVSLSDTLYDMLPDFGESLALDSKWVWSLANQKSEIRRPDGRSETDAEWGIKEYSGVRPDGVAWSSKKKCFGFKIHILVDVKYELPVAFIITAANESDIKSGKMLIKAIKKDDKRKHILERCKYFMADKAYDDEEMIGILSGEGIKAVIDKRGMWKEESEKEVPKSGGYRYYDEQGDVYCYSQEMGYRHRMIPIGYDGERDAQRFKCPACHYGATCPESTTCTLPKTIRVPLETNPRIFTEVGRTTYKWERLYAGRTAVERVNSRLDVSFGFEIRRVRGIKKMGMMAALAFAVMSTLAVSSIKRGKPELMRSLVRQAA